MFVRTCAALFGVTLLCSTAAFAQSDWPTKAVKIVVGFAPGLYPKLPYDPLKDLVQVSLVADSPSMLISRVQLPVKTLKELVAYGLGKPGDLTYGSGGQALSIAEVVAGRIDLSIASLASGAAPVKVGKAVGLAVSGKTRNSLLPEVPTFAEAGVPEYDMLYWWGIAAPANTPAPVLAQAGTATAQGAAYPSRPVRFIIQYTAGGLGDTFARVLAQHLADRLGQPFIVENRSGANGIIAMEAVAKAPADGYTVAMATQTGLVMNAVSKKNLPFDPMRDFAPVSLLFRSPFFLIMHPSVPAGSVGELIALAKAAPGKYTYASIGRGSGQHLAGEQLKMLAGIDLLHVPYKGSAPATTDLLSGHVHLMFEGGVSGLPPVKAGKLKALAVSTATRSSAMPSLPTMSEAGVVGFELATWFGFAVPAGTPRAIIDRLNAEIGDMLRSPLTTQRFATAGIDLIPSTPEEMAERIRLDLPKYTKIMRSAGIEPE